VLAVRAVHSLHAAGKIAARDVKSSTIAHSAARLGAGRRHWSNEVVESPALHDLGTLKFTLEVYISRWSTQRCPFSARHQRTHFRDNKFAGTGQPTKSWLVVTQDLANREFHSLFLP
jgi:hypothetical protein